MHQSIPAAPSPSQATVGHFLLDGPGGGALENFALPGGRAFANPGPPWRSPCRGCTQMELMHKFTAQIKRLLLMSTRLTRNFLASEQ